MKRTEPIVTDESERPFDDTDACVVTSPNLVRISYVAVNAPVGRVSNLATTAAIAGSSTEPAGSAK